MRKVDELSDEYEPREPFLEHEPTSHAAERLRIFAGATLAVALLFGGLLTYRLLGIADCNASLTGYNTARQYAVLLTGFGPYGNYTQNPTELIVQALNGSCRNGVCFYSHVLPVTDAGTWDAERLIVQAAPQDDGAPLRGWDCVLHLGYEDHARGLKLETVAKNVRAQQGGVISADYGDACTTASLIYPDSPCLLPTTAPLDRISLPGIAAGISTGGPSEIDLWSRNAGSYFSNEVYYRSLRVVRSTPLMSDGVLLPVLFIHVPSLSADSPADDVALFIGALAESILGVRSRRQ